MRCCRQEQPPDADDHCDQGQGLQLPLPIAAVSATAVWLQAHDAGYVGVKRMQELQQHSHLSEHQCVNCCRHKQLADAGVRRAQELQQQLVAAQHQVQLQCLQLTQQEAQVTAERQRVRAAQAEQIQRLSGKALRGCRCMSLLTRACRDAVHSICQMSPQGVLYRILQDTQANLHHCSYLHLTQVSGKGPSQARPLAAQCCLQAQAR